MSLNRGREVWDGLHLHSCHPCWGGTVWLVWLHPCLGETLTGVAASLLGWDCLADVTASMLGWHCLAWVAALGSPTVLRAHETPQVSELDLVGS